MDKAISLIVFLEFCKENLHEYFTKGPFSYWNQKEGMGMRMRIKYIPMFGYCNHFLFPLLRKC